MTISIAPSIENQYVVFERENRIFPFRKFLIDFMERLYKRSLRKLISLLDSAYIEIQGSIVVAKNYSREDAVRDLPIVRKALGIIITYKTLLEKADYLDSEEVRARINLIVSSMYDVETELKIKAYSGQPRTATPPDLVKAIASASKEAIGKALLN